MKNDIKSLITFSLVLFVALLFGASVIYSESNKSKGELVEKDRLTLELHQTKERYQEWEKEQAIKDTITELRVKMGEIEESFEDWHARSRRDLDRLVKRQVRGN